MYIRISREQLEEFLRDAFDAGWHGSKELRDQVVSELASKAEMAVPDLSLDDPRLFSIQSDNIVITNNLPPAVSLAPDAWMNAGDG